METSPISLMAYLILTRPNVGWSIEYKCETLEEAKEYTSKLPMTIDRQVVETQQLIQDSPVKYDDDDLDDVVIEKSCKIDDPECESCQ
jgi:hypothetical protein